MRSLILSSLNCLLLIVVFDTSSEVHAAENSIAKAGQPNVVLIFIDDMGYGDIGPFGVEGIETPNLDRMATEGRTFTDFCVSTAVCSASRAALLTGCLHRRVGISGALFPGNDYGLDPSEETIAELLKQKAYATAAFGKWHLGHHPRYLPVNQGFDEYYGLPYSNDMWPPTYGHDEPSTDPKKNRRYPPLPMIEGTTVVDADVTAGDQKQLTTQYTERATEFIRDHSDEPFFVYLPHSMVHVPLYVSDKFAGKSERGLFGDVVMEIDWSVGQVLDTLDELQLSENTLVIFTTDNGPWLNFGNHAGTAGPLREGKGTSWEGGVRVPTVMRWPGRIPANTSSDVFASTIDILPTIATIAGVDLPSKKIDGQSILPLLTGEGEQKSVHDAFPIYYAGGQLQAIRNERFKLVFPHRYRTLNGKQPGADGFPVNYDNLNAELALYDLKQDVGEQTNVADQFPEIVAELTASADVYRATLGDKLTKQVGSEVREPSHLTESDDRLVW
jgi:arylsulfatase A-like enzyme